MPVLSHVPLYHQQHAALSRRGRGSACGPSTIATLLHTYVPADKPVPELLALWYRKSRTTWIGLPAWQLARTLRPFGHARRTRRDLWNTICHEIDAGRPVACKFDKWFTLRWRGRYTYDYHWVTITGYEQDAIIVHTNSGTRRKIPFSPNKPILTLVTFQPKEGRQ